MNNSVSTGVKKSLTRHIGGVRDSVSISNV
jgi:hypothetical protein